MSAVSRRNKRLKRKTTARARTGATCPRCGTRAPRRAEVYVCGKCGAMFDNNPNEGGDYAVDPTKRLQLCEAREAAKRARKGIW